MGLLIHFLANIRRTYAPEKAPAFEQSLQELETLVQQMERGDLELEQSLAAFEKGIALIRECQTTLDAAEQRVQQLTATAQGLQLTDPEDELD